MISKPCFLYQGRFVSVDVSDDNKTLYIHCIDVDDPEALRADIANGFERKIMEALR